MSFFIALLTLAAGSGMVGLYADKGSAFDLGLGVFCLGMFLMNLGFTLTNER